MTGLPSTSGLYGDKIGTNHPGPIEFYLLAIPVRVFGMALGPTLTAATINAAGALTALWVVFRRLGSTAMLWAGVLVLAVIWSAGTAVLTDTLSSNMPLYSLIATAVLAWALIDGDLALLPLAAGVASYAAQQHLAAGLVVLALAATMAIGLTARVTTRARRGDASAWPLARRWALRALIVACVCWAPVVVDEVSGHPGNLSQIVRFARDDSRPTLGFDSGVDQVVHAVAPPTMLTRTDTTGSFFIDSIGPFRFMLGLLVVGALIVIMLRCRARFAALARLAIVALVLVFAGLVTGSNVPLSFEQVRVNLYRWTWATAFVTWTALGIGIAWLLGHVVASSPAVRRAGRFGPATLLLAAAVLAGSTVFVTGTDDHDAGRPAFRAEKRIGAVVLAQIDRRHPVVVIGDGFAATQVIAPAVIFRLVEAGIDVEVPSAQTGAYGRWRRYRPRSGATALVISTGAAPRSEPGRLLASELFDPERTGLLNDLSAATRGVTVRLAPGADARIRREYPGALAPYAQALLDRLPTDPAPRSCNPRS